MNKIFYRYRTGMGEKGRIIELQKFQAVRETEFYFYVKPLMKNWRGETTVAEYYKEKRVPKDPSSCRAICHTKEAALKSFMIRQNWRLRHASESIEAAEMAIKYIHENPEAIPDGDVNLGHGPISKEYIWS